MMRFFQCGYCGYKAPEYMFAYGRGREYGEHPEHRYCPQCHQSIDWYGYGIFWVSEQAS